MKKQTGKIYALASDHAGFELKEKIKSYLEKKNFNIVDLGPFNIESVDYPDYGKTLGEYVLDNKNSMGIAICGSGIGISIALNRLPGIRAALCNNEEIAKLSRNHNDANILVLAGRFISINKSSRIIDTFCRESFEGGRHERRVKKLG